MSVNQQMASVAEGIFSEYVSQYDAIEHINLSTTDGFPVQNVSNQNLHFDVDKMAAASSTLYSVSSAVSKQLLNKAFKITYIEAEQGNIGFISMAVSESEFVLAMSVNSSMNVGQLRVIIHRIASELLAAVVS